MKRYCCTFTIGIMVEGETEDEASDNAIEELCSEYPDTGQLIEVMDLDVVPE